MYTQFLANIAILVLAGFVGFAVISKVPNTLHTPLMSGTNAIHGIVVLGALLVLGNLPADAHWGVRIIAFRRAGVRHAQRDRRLPGHRPHARACSRARRRNCPGRKAKELAK